MAWNSLTLKLNLVAYRYFNVPSVITISVISSCILYLGLSWNDYSSVLKLVTTLAIVTLGRICLELVCLHRVLMANHSRSVLAL